MKILYTRNGLRHFFNFVPVKKNPLDIYIFGYFINLRYELRKLNFNNIFSIRKSNLPQEKNLYISKMNISFSY